MDWTDYTKQKPNKIGLYIVYCSCIGNNSNYVLCSWDGKCFSNIIGNYEIPMSTSCNDVVTYSLIPLFFSQITPPNKIN